MDGSLIKLSFAILPRACWRCTQAAVKLNMLPQVTTGTAAFYRLVPDDCHAMKVLDGLPVSTADYFVFDIGKWDFAELHLTNRVGACFIIRAKCNIRFYVCESRSVDRTTDLRFEMTIRLIPERGRSCYPERLRRISYFYAERYRYHKAIET